MSNHASTSPLSIEGALDAFLADEARAVALTIRSARNGGTTLEGGGRGRRARHGAQLGAADHPARLALLVSADRLSGTWYLTAVARDPGDTTPEPGDDDPLADR